MCPCFPGDIKDRCLWFPRMSWEFPLEFVEPQTKIRIPRAGFGGAAHGGAAGRGGDGQDGTLTGRLAQNTALPLHFPEHRRNPPLACPWEHGQRGSHVNRWGKKPRVYQQFIRGVTSALRSWLLTSGPLPICLCKPFSCKACPGFLYIVLFSFPDMPCMKVVESNPDIPRAGRVGAHGGAAGRSRAGRAADRTVRPGDGHPSYLPRHRIHIF